MVAAVADRPMPMRVAVVAGNTRSARRGRSPSRSPSPSVRRRQSHAGRTRGAVRRRRRRRRRATRSVTSCTRRPPVSIRNVSVRIAASARAPRTPRTRRRAGVGEHLDVLALGEGLEPEPPRVGPANGNRRHLLRAGRRRCRGFPPVRIRRAEQRRPQERAGERLDVGGVALDQPHDALLALDRAGRLGLFEPSTSP